MDLIDLKKQAERNVKLEYDAWADLDGAERNAVILQEMLRILENREDDLLRSRLLVARNAWETKAYTGTSESFVQFLCDAGGRYANDDGNPSGAAYDLSNYVSLAWDVLVEHGVDPVALAVQGWTKTRAMLSTVRRSVVLIGDGDTVVKRPEDAQTFVIQDPDQLNQVIDLVADETVSSREMMAKVQRRRVPQFGVNARLLQDGSWSISARGLTQQQFALLQRLIERHATIELG